MVAVATGALSFWDGPDSMAFTPFLKRSDGALAYGSKGKLTRALSAHSLEPLAFKPVPAALNWEFDAGRVPSTPSRQAPASLPPLKRDVAGDSRQLKQNVSKMSAMQEDLFGIPALRVPTPAATGFSRSKSAAVLSTRKAEVETVATEPLQARASQAQEEAKPLDVPVESKKEEVSEQTTSEDQEEQAEVAATTFAFSAPEVPEEPTAFRRVRPGELLIIVDELDELEIEDPDRIADRVWPEEDTEELTSEEELWDEANMSFNEDSFFDIEEEEV